MTEYSENKNNSYQSRLQSIDFMRGLVMVIMALDHVRDYVYIDHFDPLDLTQTNGYLYFTRWITHLCAPTFMILAGISAGLMSTKMTKIELSKFLFIRGLWLVFIEFTVVSAAWNFQVWSPNFFPGLQVIWALGVSMVGLSVLIWLPYKLLLLTAIVIIFGHNTLDGTLPINNWQTPSEPMPFWWSVHVTGFSQIFGSTVAVAYPIFPWVGVMALGYVGAPIFKMPPQQRKKILVMGGITSIVLFTVLRIPNIYGDISPWLQQESVWLNLLAILNVQKYPPSLSFLLITLGISSLIIAYAEHLKSRFTNWVVTFGKVPFFFYIVHLYIIHAIALVIASWQGTDITLILQGYWMFPATHGVNLFFTYLIWLTIVVVLYFPCKKFMHLKMRRKDWWLKYL